MINKNISSPQQVKHGKSSRSHGRVDALRSAKVQMMARILLDATHRRRTVPQESCMPVLTLPSTDSVYRRSSRSLRAMTEMQ